jgi:hypothetical protein
MRCATTGGEYQNFLGDVPFPISVNGKCHTPTRKFPVSYAIVNVNRTPNQNYGCPFACAIKRLLL